MPGRFTMPVVSRDVIWLLSQIRVISSELAKPARATATPAVHIGALTRSALASSRYTIRRPARTSNVVPVHNAVEQCPPHLSIEITF